MPEVKLRTKRDTEFILKIFSVFEGFQYKGIKYLSYISNPRKGDEFLIRDNIVKPLFTDVLDYDKQKDFVPEERIETGKPDTQILDADNRPSIIIETLESNASKAQFDEHRLRLFNYTTELRVRYAVLTNGVGFLIYRGSDRLVMVSLRFDEVYRKFVNGGIDALSDKEWKELLKLKFFSKEQWLYKPEESFKAPELDVTQETHFNNFLDGLKEMMELIKGDVSEKFEYLNLKLREFKKETTPWTEKKTEYKVATKLEESLKKWAKISSPDNSFNTFQLETMYIFFNRILLVRICEDKQITPKRFISNGGIWDYMSFEKWTRLMQVEYNKILKYAYENMEKLYPHLFREDIFDWYIPDNEVLRKVLFVFNPYNFKNVDKDILGRLYQEYISSEERKRLGQFYTPEPVIDYIFDAVGFKIDSEIEGKLILDPACGSGGFLVRAANISISRLKKKGFDAETILNKVQESIYGFEINPFACHLTETNLLFQVIDLIKEAKLSNPDFEFERFNIFQTDSLKMPDKSQFFEMTNSYWLDDAETVKQIKSKEGKFKEGFDFVVGNPPYGDVLDQQSKKTTQNRYPFVADYEISQYFVALGIELLNENGHLGYIIPNTAILNVNAQRFRKKILSTCCIPKVIDLSKIAVFIDPKVRNIILVLRKEANEEIKSASLVNALICGDMSEHSLKTEHYSKIKLESLIKDDKQWLYLFRLRFDENKMISKIRTDTLELNKIAEISQGLIPYDKYRGHSTEIIEKRIWHAGFKKDETYKKELRGEDVKRYYLRWNGQQWISYGDWLGAPREPKFFTSPRILIREITDEKTGSINATYTDEEYYNNPSIINIINKPGEEYNLKFLLAIINSRLFAFYHLHTSPKARKGLFPKILVKDVRDLPIKPSSQKTQQEFVALVDEILKINETLPVYEAKIKNIQEFLKEFNFPLGDLADISGLKIELKERIGKTKPIREGSKIYLDRKSFIECENEYLAEYIDLFLQPISNGLQGKTRTEIVKLIQIPKSLESVKEVLKKRTGVFEEMETLKQKRAEIDKEIDEKVCDLYLLNEQERETIG